MTDSMSTATRFKERRLQALDPALTIAPQESKKDQTKSPFEELEALSYSVSHDLRAPLRSIQSNCEWLNSKHAKQLDSEGRAMLQRIASSSEHMEKLLDGLLDLSRAASLDYKFSLLDMTALTRSVVDELLKTDEGNSSLLISIQPLQPAWGDATLIRQVWFNLLSNAFKYTRYLPQRKIIVESHQEDNIIMYSVSDNGAGFDMQYANQLFHAFHRLHESEKFEGIGVGLAIVQQIIRKHGGRVWAEGKVDQGARFYFALPIR
jgi:light-regulated signal transduction histidine kinase (bacteriophytochrome)